MKTWRDSSRAALRALRLGQGAGRCFWLLPLALLAVSEAAASEPGTGTIIAVPSNKLTVQSTPDAGVPIMVAPPDADQQAGDTTPFTRRYRSERLGATVSVSLVAPEEHNGKRFERWTKDGKDAGTNRSIKVTIDGDHTLVAVYREAASTTQRTLTVKSTPEAGAAITVRPTDASGRGGGTTHFSRTYDKGTNVSLGAKEKLGDRPFRKWTRDGKDYATAPSITVPADGDSTMVAVYGDREPPIQQVNPDGPKVGTDKSGAGWQEGFDNTLDVTVPGDKDKTPDELRKQREPKPDFFKPENMVRGYRIVAEAAGAGPKWDLAPGDLFTHDFDENDRPGIEFVWPDLYKYLKRVEGELKTADKASSSFWIQPKNVPQGWLHYFDTKRADFHELVGIEIPKDKVATVDPDAFRWSVTRPTPPPPGWRPIPGILTFRKGSEERHMLMYVMPTRPLPRPATTNVELRLYHSSGAYLAMERHFVNMGR